MRHHRSHPRSAASPALVLIALASVSCARSFEWLDDGGAAPTLDCPWNVGDGVGDLCGAAPQRTVPSTVCRTRNGEVYAGQRGVVAAFCEETGREFELLLSPCLSAEGEEVDVIDCGVGGGNPIRFAGEPRSLFDPSAAGCDSGISEARSGLGERVPAAELGGVCADSPPACSGLHEVVVDVPDAPCASPRLDYRCRSQVNGNRITIDVTRYPTTTDGASPCLPVVIRQTAVCTTPPLPSGEYVVVTPDEVPVGSFLVSSDGPNGPPCER